MGECSKVFDSLFHDGTVFAYGMIQSCSCSCRYKCASRLIVREIQIHRDLNHPHIVKILDVFENVDKQKIYLVMEYCPFDLTRLMEMNLWGTAMPANCNAPPRTGNDGNEPLFTSQDMNGHFFSFSSSSISDSPDTFPLPIPIARHYFKQLLNALVFLSSQHIVHHGTVHPFFIAIACALLVADRVLVLDIKPTNLLIGLDGTLKVTDFGISFKAESFEPEGDALHGATLGSPAFQAPETLVDGPLMHSPFKLDIWAAGVTLYESDNERGRA